MEGEWPFGWERLGSWLIAMVDFDRSAVTTNLCGRESSGNVVAGEGTDIGFFGWSPSDEPYGASIAKKGVGGGDSPDS